MFEKSLEEELEAKRRAPVECLGMTFENDEKRREYFLEKLRERALMREFEEYRQSKQKQLKVSRLEAVCAGFKKAWQERDYATIIAVARKIPEKILQEDPKLLMWFYQAVTRTGEAETR
jgi:FlaA1/EpsC-like NDP-sugar epimerase